ncbi:hypothetical protein BV20DRAFT_964929 [Pilatotrama ljubarskyi]|nr:hypothetical protein BV20DRAFT_964929 [Pilatotrama ljubarskyi]
MWRNLDAKTGGTPPPSRESTVSDMESDGAQLTASWPRRSPPRPGRRFGVGQLRLQPSFVYTDRMGSARAEALAQTPSRFRPMAFQDGVCKFIVHLWGTSPGHSYRMTSARNLVWTTSPSRIELRNLAVSTRDVLKKIQRLQLEGTHIVFLTIAP